MDAVLPYIALAIVLAVFGLTAAIVLDRGRRGWARAAQEVVMRRRRLEEMQARTDQMRRAADEQRGGIEGVERQVVALREEMAALQRRLDATELPFAYTAVPIGSGDMYGPTWRFVARHTALGEGAPQGSPAAAWGNGRGYIVGATNQSEARSIMDRLLPRHRGFTIAAIGEPVGSPPAS